jgi:hypothetical protein
MGAHHWSSGLSDAARALRERGRRRASEMGGWLAPRTPVAELSTPSGPELARQRLREAAAALLATGATQADAFRQLRLELNRLEQGGLAQAAARDALQSAAIPPAPIPTSPRLLGGALLHGLRARSRDLALRVLGPS